MPIQICITMLHSADTAAAFTPESSRALGQRKLILAQAWMISREIHLAPVAIVLKRAALSSTVLR